MKSIRQHELSAKLFTLAFVWCGIQIQPQSVWAQGGSSGMGGGGDILLDCTQAGVTKNYLLDAFENSSFRFSTGSSTTLVGKLDFVLSRFGALDPARANRYAARIRAFLQDIEKIRAGQPEAALVLKKAERPLNDIDDSDETYDFRALGCKEKKQLARQETSLRTGQVEFIVDFDLFETLDADNQAATLMHEVIYEEARALGAQTSRASREMNRLVFSEEAGAITLCQYHQRLKNLGLGTFLILGSTLFEDSGAECSSAGALQKLGMLKLPLELYGSPPRPADNKIVLFYLNQVEMQGRSLKVARGIYSSGYITNSKVGEVLGSAAEVSSTKGKLAPSRHFSVKFDASGSLLWSGLQVLAKRERETSAFVTLRTNGALQVLERWEGNQVSVSLSSASEPELESFVNLAIDLRKSSKLSEARLTQVLAWLRQELLANRSSSIARAVQMLNDESILVPPVSVLGAAPFDPVAQEWSTRLLDSSIKTCKANVDGLTAALIFGVRLVRLELKCEHWNGEESKYRGKVGFPFALGAGFFIGRSTELDVVLEDVSPSDKSRSKNINSKDLMVRDTFFAAVLGIKSPVKQRPVFGLGLSAQGSLMTYATIKFKWKAQNYDVSNLTHRLLDSVPAPMLP